MKRVVLLLFVFLLACQVSATYISMTPEVDADSIASGSFSVVNLSLVNLGDEAAYDVVASLDLPEGFSAESIFFGVMAPNESAEGKFNMSFGNVSPGTYSLPLVVEYADANGHRFSAVHVFSFNIGEAAFSRVSAGVSDVSLAEGSSSELRVSLRNLEEQDREVKVDLVLPRELSSDSDGKVAVKGKGNAERAFQVSSLDALAGSSYMVFAVVSYEDDGVHHSSFSRGMVKVVSPQTGIPSWVFIAALLALLSAFVLYQFKK